MSTNKDYSVSVGNDLMGRKLLRLLSKESTWEIIQALSDNPQSSVEDLAKPEPEKDKPNGLTKYSRGTVSNCLAMLVDADIVGVIFVAHDKARRKLHHIKALWIILGIGDANEEEET